MIKTNVSYVQYQILKATGYNVKVIKADVKRATIVITK